MSIFYASALFNLASGLQGGQSCFCNPFQTPKIGSLNWAIIIIVSSTDGEEGKLRLRCHEIAVLYSCTVQSSPICWPVRLLLSSSSKLTVHILGWHPPLIALLRINMADGTRGFITQIII